MSDALHVVDKVIQTHSAYVEKRYYHYYRDYEKRHLRWKHDQQDGIKYAEPVAPNKDELSAKETIPMTLHLLVAISELYEQGVSTVASAGNV